MLNRRIAHVEVPRDQKDQRSPLPVVELRIGQKDFHFDQVLELVFIQIPAFQCHSVFLRLDQLLDAGLQLPASRH